MSILFNLPPKQIKLKYFLTYLLFAYSGGNNVLLGNAIMLLGFLLIVTIFILNKIKIDNFLFFLVAAFIILFFLQYISSGIIPYTTQIGFLIRILIAYFAIKIVGKEFPKFYINLMVIFSLISFVFYIPIVFSPSFEHFLSGHIAPLFAHYDYSTGIYKPFPQFIIYTVNTQRDISIIARNSGPFWEPGAFAGYLIIGIIFNLIISKKLLKNKKSIILGLALLSTLSTTGYLAFGVLIISYLFTYVNLDKKIIWIPVILIAFYFIYNQFNFLSKKIEKDLKYSTSGPTQTLARTRFVGAELDIEELMESPILGKGLVAEDYSYSIKKKINHRTNGDTHFANQFGLILFFIYFYSMYRSFRALCLVNNVKTKFAVFILGIIFILGFSELYFNMPMFIAFIFLNFLYFESFHSIKILNNIKFNLMMKLKDKRAFIKN